MTGRPGTGTARLGALSLGALLLGTLAAGTPRPLAARQGARELYDAGNVAAALDAVEEGLRASPDDVGLLALEGRIRFEAGARAAAIPPLERALRIGPRDAGEASRLRYMLALSYERVGRGDQGVGLLRGALERDPADGLAHYALGWILLDRGDLTPARRQLALASELGIERARGDLDALARRERELRDVRAADRLATGILAATFLAGIAALALGGVWRVRSRAGGSNEAGGGSVP